MGPEHMEQIGSFIHRALESVGDAAALKSLTDEVAEFCSGFSLHP
jgi:glycine/serine hydroxymethyltransferase